MNHNDLSSKLAQVIEQIPRDVLYDFCCSYAQEHEELAMALVNEFWRPEKDDYRSMVQQCLIHPSPSDNRNGDGYDWGAVAADLSRMMTLADEKVKQGSLLDAAEIARYVMTLTCAEYEADQRLVAQDIVERMKLRAPECKRGDDYDHFAGWIRRFYNSSPECEKIAREVAEEIVKENPNKAFRRMFERIGVIK